MATENPWRRTLDRRELLKIGAKGAAALSVLGTTRIALGACVTQPSETQGPYWVDEMLNRADIRSDPTTGNFQQGLPLRLQINVSETTGGMCAPLAGAWVDIWHCNALGVYSDANGGGNPNTLGQKWLRGYQVTDAHGNVRFLTIYPGWYMGRTVHIHYRIRRFSGPTTTFNFTSQVYFNDAISNSIYASTFPYFQHPNRNPASNQQDSLYNAALNLRMSYNGDHVVASFNAVVNSVAGLDAEDTTPLDPEAEEHANDFGGGTPPLDVL